jgi:hypothetical protein
MRSFSRFLLRTVNEPVNVLCVKELAAKGSIPGEELPAIIEIDAVGAIAVLLLKRSCRPHSSASKQAPFSFPSFLKLHSP